MDKEILNQLKIGVGKLAWITFLDDTKIRAGIHEIDEQFETVKLINGKGLRELQELQKKKILNGGEDDRIVNNPENFSIIPIKNIKEVIPSS